MVVRLPAYEVFGPLVCLDVLTHLVHLKVDYSKRNLFNSQTQCLEFNRKTLKLVWRISVQMHERLPLQTPITEHTLYPQLPMSLARRGGLCRKWSSIRAHIDCHF